MTLVSLLQDARNVKTSSMVVTTALIMETDAISVILSTSVEDQGLDLVVRDAVM
jgi:hypothetical protein